MRHKQTFSNEKSRFHIHDEFEVLLSLSSGMKLETADKTYILPHYSLLLFNSMDLHLLSLMSPDTENNRYVVYFRPEYINALSTERTDLLECFMLRPFADANVLPLEERAAMVIYLAALQGVSREVYEAAQIDSAGPLQTFWRITVPMVKNTTLYLMTVLTIGGFGAYIHVMMITEGAPLGLTNQIMNLMYFTAFSKYDFGYAAAQAVAMGAMIFILTMVQRRLTRETVN